MWSDFRGNGSAGFVSEVLIFSSPELSPSNPGMEAGVVLRGFVLRWVLIKAGVARQTQRSEEAKK